ncbi:unnamed protein product [marine sediment metagenome]|uniref:Uncharacterized protein n=1 Tax=marine sediment metagenome TaxID=412755 RepID=X1F142_9ZZZZ
MTALQLAYARHTDLEVLVPSTYGGEIAAANTAQGSRRPDRWTRESFVGALEDPADKSFLARILDRLDHHHQSPDHRDPLWYGARPGGGLFFHLFGLKYPPFQLAINSAGRLTIKGTWQGFREIAGHPGFAELAAMLGQDENGPTRFVPVADLDPETLWNVAETTARLINS